MFLYYINIIQSEKALNADITAIRAFCNVYILF